MALHMGTQVVVLMNGDEVGQFLRRGGDCQRCRRWSVGAGCTLHLNIGAASAVAGAVGLWSVLLVVLLAAAALGGGLSGVFGLAGLSSRCGPAGDFPNDTCEALECEASSGPLATRLARPVEGSKASVDRALVCLGSKFVSARGSAGSVVMIDRSVF